MMTNEFYSGSSTVAAARLFRPKEKGRKLKICVPHVFVLVELKGFEPLTF
jgi:hypothetical protein